MSFDEEGEIYTPNSTFTSVVAWLFIILSSFSTFMISIQFVMMKSILPKMISQIQNEGNFPEQGHMFLDVFFIVIFVISAFVLFCSIWLLKRKNWARIVVMILLSFGIILNITVTAFQFFEINNLAETNSPNAIPPEFGDMMQVMSISSIIFCIVISSLFLFLIVKFKSKNIKAEFKNA